MKASIVDLRYHMKDVLRAIDRGETVTVLYRGKEKARIVPLDSREKGAVRTVDTPFFGMWKDREDMADPAAYIRKLREPRLAHLYEGGLFPAAQPKRKGKPKATRQKPANPRASRGKSR